MTSGAMVATSDARYTVMLLQPLFQLASVARMDANATARNAANAAAPAGLPAKSRPTITHEAAKP